MADAKVVPSFPMLVEGVGSFRSNPSSDRFLHKHEVSAEFIGFRSWQIVQGVVRGKCELKWVSNC